MAYIIVIHRVISVFQLGRAVTGRIPICLALSADQPYAPNPLQRSAVRLCPLKDGRRLGSAVGAGRRRGGGGGLWWVVRQDHPGAADVGFTTRPEAPEADNALRIGFQLWGWHIRNAFMGMHWAARLVWMSGAWRLLIAGLTSLIAGRLGQTCGGGLNGSES